MNKAVIYSRVSTIDQTTENQLNVLREVAEKKGIEVVREISDKGISGAKGRDDSKWNTLWLEIEKTFNMKCIGLDKNTPLPSNKL